LEDARHRICLLMILQYNPSTGKVVEQEDDYAFYVDVVVIGLHRKKKFKKCNVCAKCCICCLFESWSLGINILQLLIKKIILST
jgi:hypothetical protein